MKQIVFFISAVVMALALPDPSCMPPNVPKDATFVDCCQMKVEMIPADVLTKCEASIPKPALPPPPPSADGSRPPMPHFGAVCAAECALKELKIYVDGKIDKAAAISLLSSKDASVKPTVESAVNYCYDKSSKMPQPPMNGTMPCNFIPMFMTGCVYGQIYKSCGSQLAAKEECKKLSEFADKCDWVPPMKCKTEA